MNLWFRLLWLLLTPGNKPFIALDLEVTRHFRVLPTDLDLNGHMTNSRYNAMMDLASLGLAARLGLLRLSFRRRWRPVVSATMVTYRRSLNPLRVYRIRSRIVFWNDCWSYIEHHFERNGEVVAIGLTRNVFVSREGTVPVSQLLGALGAPALSPPCPEHVRLWRDTEERLAASAGMALKDCVTRGVSEHRAPALGSEAALCSDGTLVRTPRIFKGPIKKPKGAEDAIWPNALIGTSSAS